MWNLVENACKFSADGRPDRAGRGPGAGRRPRSRARHRPGRPRATSSTASTGRRPRARCPGSGLGLAIVRDVAESHGGSRVRRQPSRRAAPRWASGCPSPGGARLAAPGPRVYSPRRRRVCGPGMPSAWSPVKPSDSWNAVDRLLRAGPEVPGGAGGDGVALGDQCALQVVDQSAVARGPTTGSSPGAGVRRRPGGCGLRGRRRASRRRTPRGCRTCPSTSLTPRRRSVSGPAMPSACEPLQPWARWKAATAAVVWAPYVPVAPAGIE